MDVIGNNHCSRNNVRSDEQIQLLRGKAMTGVWHRMQQRRVLQLIDTRIYRLQKTAFAASSVIPIIAPILIDRVITRSISVGAMIGLFFIENSACILIWCTANSIDIENPGDASLHLVGSSNGFRGISLSRMEMETKNFFIWDTSSLCQKYSVLEISHHRCWAVIQFLTQIALQGHHFTTN